MPNNSSMESSRVVRAPGPEERGAGFTLVEVIVALGLIAIMMTSLAGLFYASMRTAATANRRTEATGVATRELEAMRALPYPALGFYSNQGAGSDGLGTTVILGPTAPADVLFTPTGTSKPGPVTFAVSRFVVWGAANASNSEAYKRTRVRVSWTDDTGTHSVVQNSIVYPGSCGRYAARNTCGSAPSPTVGIAPDPPTGVAAVRPADLTQAQTTISVSWTAPAAGVAPAGYVVEFSTDQVIWMSSPVLSSATTSLSVSPLASDTQYYFRVLTVSSDGMFSVPSSTTNISTLSASTSTCVVTALYVNGVDTKSTTKVYLSQTTNLMFENLNLHVTTNRGCSTSAFAVRSTFGAVADPGSPWALTPVNGGYSRVAATDNATGWSAGVHTFTVTRNGNPVTPSVTHPLLVCQYKNLAERSPDPAQC